MDVSQASLAVLNDIYYVDIFLESALLFRFGYASRSDNASKY